MGLQIKEKDGKYTLKDTVNDKIIAKNVSIKKVRKVLVQRIMYSAVCDMLQAFNDFPHGYSINDKRESYSKDKPRFIEDHIKNWNDPKWLDVKITELEKATGVFDFALGGTGYKVVKDETADN